MYICRWFVLCESVVNDKFTNNLTMVNAITEIHVNGFPNDSPIHYPRFAFAALLEREGKAEGNVSLRFVREEETGDQILMNVGNNQEPPRINFFMVFPVGIRLFKEGVVTFRIDVSEGDGEWYSVGSQYLQVDLTKPKKETPTHRRPSSQDST